MKEGGLILGVLWRIPDARDTVIRTRTILKAPLKKLKDSASYRQPRSWSMKKSLDGEYVNTLASSIFEQGLEVDGYEIHSGRTQFQRDYPLLFQSSNGDYSYSLGLCNEEGTVTGTYLHGFLDKDPIREGFLNYIRQRKSLPQPKWKVSIIGNSVPGS